MENINKIPDLPYKIFDVTDKRIYDLWKLYRKSGFVYASKKKYIFPVIKKINQTFKLLLSPKTAFSKCAGYFKNDKLLGSACVVQTYEHTWLHQHLAAMGHPLELIPKHIIMELVRFLAKNSSAKYLQTYYRADNTWPVRTFGAFGEKFPNKELMDFTTYSFLDRDIVEENKAYGESGEESQFIVEELERGNPALVKEVCRLIENRIGSQILIDAYSLGEKDIFIPNISNMYFARGLMRKRRIFLLKQNNKILSCALVEISSVGLNLSGILSSFRVYDNKANTCNIDVGKNKLIRRVLSLYAESQEPKAILLTDEKDLSLYYSMGFKKHKEYICFTGSQKGFAAFCDFMEQNYSRSALRKAFKARKNNHA